MGDAPRTWVLTSSPDNHAATAAHAFSVILAHIRKWPAEHWKLAFPGQLRTVSEADATLLMDRMHASSGVAA
jgi:hypothetical protein